MAKLAKAKKKKKDPGMEIAESFIGYIMPIFAMILCIFLPIYMRDGYYKIGTAKYMVYKNIVMFGMPVLLLLVLIWSVFFLCQEDKEPINWGYIKKQFSVTDCFAFSFLILSIISYFASEFRSEGFWGYDGWFMGLFSQITFVLIYMIYSRFGSGWQVIFSTLGVTSVIAFIIGILHRLLIDPIGVYANISDYYKTQFLSTLGQASWYSSFICTVMPIGVVCFFLAKKTWLRVLSGIYTFLGFMTLVSQNSDSAYIAFFVEMLILLYVASDSAFGMMRLSEIAFFFGLAPKVMFFLLKLHPNSTLDLDTLSTFLIFSKWSWIISIFFGILTILFWKLDQKNISILKQMHILRNVVYIVVLIAIAFAFLIIRLGIRGKLSGGMLEFAQKVPYLTYDDQWGNGRGFTWTATCKIIREMPLGRKLFGVGPDCYPSYAYKFYEEYIRSKWGDNILQNAHNEWMNMVVNEGFLGAIAYLGFYLSALVRYLLNHKKSPLLLAVATCIGAYVGHNIFCYQQVLCTPFIFLFIALGEYQLRKSEASSEK